MKLRAGPDIRVFGVRLGVFQNAVTGNYATRVTVVCGGACLALVFVFAAIGRPPDWVLGVMVFLAAASVVDMLVTTIYVVRRNRRAVRMARTEDGE